MNKEYKYMSDVDLRNLLESQSIEDYEKMEILEELINRGSVEFVKEEWIH